MARTSVGGGWAGARGFRMDIGVWGCFFNRYFDVGFGGLVGVEGGFGVHGGQGCGSVGFGALVSWSLIGA